MAALNDCTPAELAAIAEWFATWDAERRRANFGPLLEIDAEARRQGAAGAAFDYGDLGEARLTNKGRRELAETFKPLTGKAAVAELRRAVKNGEFTIALTPEAVLVWYNDDDGKPDGEPVFTTARAPSNRPPTTR